MWVLLLLSVVSPPIIVDHLDICELNHVICPTNGNEQGVYWVWWRWQTVDGVADYFVADWIRQSECPRPINGVQEFWDKKAKVTRHIKSRVFIETWSIWDRESEDRKRLPENKRRKLTRVERGQVNPTSQGTP